MHSTWVLYIAIALLATSFDRLNVDGEERAMRVVKVGSNGQIFMCAHSEANVELFQFAIKTAIIIFLF